MKNEMRDEKGKLREKFEPRLNPDEPGLVIRESVSDAVTQIPLTGGYRCC